MAENTLWLLNIAVEHGPFIDELPEDNHQKIPRVKTELPHWRQPAPILALISIIIHFPMA